VVDVVEVVVERWWRERVGAGAVHHCVGGVYATRDVLAVEKGVSAAVMATIERGRPFIDVASLEEAGR
jgi:hypothetical protein